MIDLLLFLVFVGAVVACIGGPHEVHGTDIQSDQERWT